MIGVLFEKFDNIVPISGFSDEMLSVGSYVVIETSRGIEIGKLVKTIAEKPLHRGIEIKLKKLIRYATKENLEKYSRIKAEEKKLIRQIKKKCADLNAPVSILDAELLFDESKLIVYYKNIESKNAFSPKQFIKDISSDFSVKIEMHSLGPREQAKLVSGIGPCGRKICCASFLKDFPHVPVKMLKEQGIAINQSKICGLCGKFLCCLKYETEAFQNSNAKEESENDG